MLAARPVQVDRPTRDDTQIEGPYILVGRSIAALSDIVFAGRYPEDTAGLVDGAREVAVPAPIPRGDLSHLQKAALLKPRRNTKSTKGCSWQPGSEAGRRVAVSESPQPALTPGERRWATST